jgi:hypothetical protein
VSTATLGSDACSLSHKSCKNENSCPALYRDVVLFSANTVSEIIDHATLIVIPKCEQSVELRSEPDSRGQLSLQQLSIVVDVLDHDARVIGLL